MTAYQSPFQFGTLATNDNFIDRVEDRAFAEAIAVLSYQRDAYLTTPMGQVVASQESDE